MPIYRKIPCETCKGTGIEIAFGCTKCDATGQIRVIDLDGLDGEIKRINSRLSELEDVINQLREVFKPEGGSDND